MSSNLLLTGQNQLQLTYNPVYPDISDSQWGIDTVTLTFKVGINDYDPFFGWKATIQADGTLTSLSQSIPYGNQKVFIFINVSKGWCFISLNAAKLVHTDPLKLLDPDELAKEIQKLLLFIFPYVSSFAIWNKHKSPVTFYPDWQNQLNLKRLDIAINLKRVTKQHMHELKSAKIPRSNKVVIYESPTVVETICMFTKGEGQRKIYDKTVDLDAKHDIQIPYQVHRFEAQLQNGRLLPVKNLQVISRSLIWNLLKQHWQEGGFRLHIATDPLADAINLLYPKIGSRVVEYMKDKREGRLISISPGTARKYEKIIQETQNLLNPNMPIRNYLELENLI